MPDGLPDAPEAELAILGACMASSEAYRTAQGLVGVDDFFSDRHREMWAAVCYWNEMGATAEPTLVLDRLRELNQVGPTTGPRLFEAVSRAAALVSVPYYARIVADAATRRRLVRAAQSIGQRATLPGDVADLVEQGMNDLRAVSAARVGVERLTVTSDVFLKQAPDRPVWVVPGLLCRGDRMVLTGEGGLGKSTLALQVAVMAAAGVAPLRWHIPGTEYAPVRAMVIDCENPDHRVKGRVWPLVKTLTGVDRPVENRLTIGGHGKSLDVLDASQALSLLRTVEHDQPDLVYIGPFYKLHNDDPDKEVVVKKVTHVLDQVREIGGAALIIEAHHNKAAHSGGSLAPSGSNMWNWWPELGFGLRLDPDSSEELRRCTLVRWRIDRDLFEWPRYIEAGGRFPWVAAR